ncbi:cell division ATP-binding protein FtsE [Anaerocolumna xylanovorans]|uniref:Cell division transport system ATP-binding protein n=1 Tax=Anaerocolumna xylanovorans DSM 12503 TaxID=1121345 RepID=A0A1M7XZX5_9FIRM|nr:ATP-binding cassette domain-containing protein [Anaerocolumna xylanovorans]SHO44761.1 cell division transport system ATP-binding protein [Anaerocolumna xylanovorans DSM 12503]
MISAKDVSLVYQDGTLALDKVSVTLKEGELVFLTGPSGSGKTSFLKLLMGMELPTAGNLTIGESAITDMGRKELRRYRQSIGPVFQEFRLIEKRTALENVMLGLRFLEDYEGRIKDMALEALNKVGLLHKAYGCVEQLSFGEAQRVAIARAVVRKPDLILADEPTGNLDQENAVKILTLLASFQKENTTVIITTHAAHLLPEDREFVHLRMESGKMSAERSGDSGEKLL